MPERLLNQTWTIRTVSPFSTPWDVSDLRELELQATAYLRDFVKTHGRVERDGTYVSIDWVSIDTLSKHLYFDIRIADEPTAQVVLSCAKPEETSTATRPPTIMVNSFSFCLVHGERKPYEIILKFLETNVGCVVGDKSFRPSSSHVAKILLDTIHAVGPASTQMEITFATPRQVKNLDEFSISIPPTSFQRLLMDLEYNRPEERRNMVTVEEDTPRMIFKALRGFILEAMRIDIQSFPIVRVANNILIFGGSGKVRMLNQDHMHDVLENIERMIMAQVVREKKKTGPKRKRGKKESGAQSNSEEEDDMEDELEYDRGDDYEDHTEQDVVEGDVGTEKKAEVTVEEATVEEATAEDAVADAIGGMQEEVTAEDVVADAMGGMPVVPHLDGDLESKEFVAI